MKMLVERNTAFTANVYLELDTGTDEAAEGLVDADFTVKQYRLPGGAWTTIAGAITESDYGVYNVPISGAENTAFGLMWLRLEAVGIVSVTVCIAEIVGFDPQSPVATSVELGDLQTDVTDIQSRLPAALVSGRMDASVGAMAAGVVTAAAVATGAIDADALAADAVTEIQTGLATPTDINDVQADIATLSADVAAVAAAIVTVQADTDNIQTRLPAALVSGRIDAHVGAMGAGVVTASAVATDAIDADALAASAVAEIQNGLVTSGDVTDINTKLDTLEAVAVGRWRVTNNQLILYQMDGVTPLATFDLFDDDGNPSSTRIFERVPA